MKKKKWLLLPAPAVAIVLEALPFGAVLNFGSPVEPSAIRRTYSYFDLTPYGYANFGPFLTAILTCLLFLTTLVYIRTGRGRAVMRGLSLAACLTSLLPLLLGPLFFSLLGGAISVVLGIQLLLTLSIKASKPPC